MVDGKQTAVPWCNCGGMEAGQTCHPIRAVLSKETDSSYVSFLFSPATHVGEEANA